MMQMLAMGYILVKMKKILLFFYLLSVSITSIAQENWLELVINNPLSEERIKEVIPITNTKTGDLALFYKTRSGLLCYLFNNKQELTNTFAVDTLPDKSDIFIGEVTSDNKIYNLFFTNSNGNKLGSIQINFQTESALTNNNFELPKKEKVIQFVNHEGGLFLVTSLKKSSILKLYTFNIHGKAKSQVADFSNEIFENDNGLSKKFHDLIFQGSEQKTIAYITNNSPNSLETTSAKTKLYLNENTLRLTNNLFNKNTFIVDFNIKEHAHKLTVLENQDFIKKQTGANTNSYILDDYFFRVYATTEKLNLAIYNLKTNTLQKEFVINKGEPISFKNTPIIQEGGEFDTYRELEKTSKFLRKIVYSNVGIIAYKINDNYVLTLGASKDVSLGNLAMVGAMTGGALGAIVGGLLSTAFQSYLTTKSTRILSVLDQNFNHTSGDIPVNSFDKIDTFIVNKSGKENALQTIFKYQNITIWGSYNKTNKIYTFTKFRN